MDKKKKVPENMVPFMRYVMTHLPFNIQELEEKVNLVALVEEAEAFYVYFLLLIFLFISFFMYLSR